MFRRLLIAVMLTSFCSPAQADVRKAAARLLRNLAARLAGERRVADGLWGAGFRYASRYDHVLFISDQPPPDDVLAQPPDNLIQAFPMAVEGAVRSKVGEARIPSVVLPKYELPLEDLAFLAIGRAREAQLIADSDNEILVVLDRDQAAKRRRPVLMPISLHDADKRALTRAAEGLHNATVDAVIDVARSIGRGHEGHQFGALFVVGDSSRVLGLSEPMGFDPFAEKPREMKDIFNPAVQDALHWLAAADGATVVDDNGRIRGFSRNLLVERAKVAPLPGKGTRHRAAQRISSMTDAISVVVSQSTGAVEVYRRGKRVEAYPSMRGAPAGSPQDGAGSQSAAGSRLEGQRRRRRWSERREER